MDECAEQYLRKLTLRRKRSFWGRSGPRISNIAVGSSYRFYFFVYARKAWKIRQKKQTFTNYHQWRVQALSIRTVLLTSMQRLCSKPTCRRFAWPLHTQPTQLFAYKSYLRVTATFFVKLGNVVVDSLWGGGPVWFRVTTLGVRNHALWKLCGGTLPFLQPRGILLCSIYPQEKTTAKYSGRLW